MLRSSTDGPVNDPLEDGLSKGKAPTDKQAEDPSLLTDKDWVKMFKSALKASTDFQQSKLRASWSRNYRAFQNRHMNGSKYDTYRYRHRSKLFRPKTRMAVRKNNATVASALFSTEDAVSITAERASDRVQQMTARFIGAALNYRLDRSTKKAGPNWFLTAVGASQDAQLTGICVSKQHWEYEEREFEVQVDAHEQDETGAFLFHPDGEPSIQTTIEKQSEIVRDRLMITLIPGEHAIIDVTADWRDPVQEGGYFGAAYPVRREDLETTLDKQAKRPKMGGGAWRTDIDLAAIMKAASPETNRSAEAVRRAREDGQDRYESRFTDQNNGDIVWLIEFFYRYSGEDWHWWMLGETIMLSTPQPTRDAYPEQKGDRPYVMGVGSLESHKTHPMAPVESWQPLQQEINDVTNLTLDAQKMAISPITKIRRGRNIDFKQVQNRGPDAQVMVQEPDDVTFEKAPGPGGEQQLQINNLNVDFDELSGTFSQGSVQTNRQLNETVGGMNLLAGSANGVTEFDLRVFAETWATPCLRQCVRLEQFYESDETVMAVAGEQAGLIILPQQQPQQGGPLDQLPPPQQDGLPPITFRQVMDNLDDAALAVRVNIGIGAHDPRQRFEKFGMGLKMTAEMTPILQASQIMPDAAELMTEGWGLLGYKDANRFFKPAPPSGPPPEVQKMQMEMELAKQKAELDAQAKQRDMQLRQQEFQMQMMQTMAEIRADQQKQAMELAAMREQNAITVQSQRIKQQGQIADQRIKQHGAIVDQRMRQQAAADQHTQAMEQGDQAFRVEQAQADDTHRQGMEHADQSAKAKVAQAKAAAKARPQQSKGKGKPGK